MILLKLTSEWSEWSCDLFFLPKGYVDRALFTIIVKKNDMQTYFNVDEGKPRKPPLVFQWNLKPFL